MAAKGRYFSPRIDRRGLDVALKVIPLTTGDESAAERLRREARRLAKLSHPALPTCHALVEDLRRGTIGVSLELIEGASLNELPGPLERHEQHALLSQVASALAYLHGKGLVHRDLAPRNIMLTRGFREDRWRPGCVKLVDLGLSIEQGNPRPLTSLGRIVGTAPLSAARAARARSGRA